MTDPLRLDELAAKEREARGVGPTFPWSGETWQLPVLLPFSILDVLANPTDGGFWRATRDLLSEDHPDADPDGPAQYDRFMSTNPPLAVVTHLVEHAFELYGTDLPKSGGSSEPSTDAGKDTPSEPSPSETSNSGTSSGGDGNS